MAAAPTTILVIADDALLRAHVSRTLLGLGYRVLEVGDPEEAMRVVERESIDLVLSDIEMQLMDGITLIERLRRRRSEALNVLFMSETSLSGSDGSLVLAKPFTPAELAQRVEDALKPR